MSFVVLYHPHLSVPEGYSKQHPITCLWWIPGPARWWEVPSLQNSFVLWYSSRYHYGLFLKRKVSDLLRQFTIVCQVLILVFSLHVLLLLSVLVFQRSFVQWSFTSSQGKYLRLGGKSHHLGQAITILRHGICGCLLGVSRSTQISGPNIFHGGKYPPASFNLGQHFNWAERKLSRPKMDRRRSKCIWFLHPLHRTLSGN